jgi:hypothetical protein
MSGMTFPTFSKQVLTAIGIGTEGKGQGVIGEHGLVMTSVPLSNGTQGGSQNPTGADQTTLAEIPTDCVFDTEAKAEAATDKAACIYVERAAVKVEVKLGTGVTDPITNNALDATNFSWGLGNTNTTYFNTRQVKSDWLPYYNSQMANADLNMKYRFVGNTAFFSSGHRPAAAYRTYWAEDVNYNRDVNEGELANAKVTTYGYNLSTTTTPVYAYTFENTFDQDHQTYMNTTYVGVKVQLNGGTAFWTVSSDADTKLEDAAEAANKIQQEIDIAINGSVISVWKSNIETEITTQLANAGSALRTAGAAATDKFTFKLSHNVQITTGTRNADGSHPWTDALTITEIKQNNTAITSGAIYDAIVAIITAEGALAQLDERTDVQALKLKAYSYTNGYAYYQMRISHFGDTETPWDADPTDANKYAKIYPENGTNPLLGTSGINFGATRAAAWLGRWGVVRNNWYQLSIDAITGIGSAEPVDYYGDADYKDTPDDNPKPKYYIAAHIHILPWVLRTQSVSF